ncbi:MAG: thioredoxin family protein [Muribaculaceae bacterium]|nr:thioredoxin family protein [Muribaculaceae bacterium]
MSKIFRFSLILILTLLCACGKNEFKLKFSLPKDYSSNIRLVYYASDKRGGMVIEAVATIMEGKGELRSPTYNPTLLYLYAGGNVPTVVYVERHDEIEISGKESNAALWTIGGNRVNEDLTLWRNAHATTLLSGTPKEINEAVADYVEGNRDNPVSAILLLTAFSRSDDERQFLDLWYGLGEKAEKERWMKIVGRSDLLHSAIRHPGKLLSMAPRSLANGIDTIRPSAVAGTILFFWNNGMDSRKELMDSLKVLAEEYPDSSARIIADISVDADSVSWRSPLRNDSVKNIARFWFPAGLADPRLMSLQVTKTPFFMVVTPDGYQSYRGDNVDDAMKAFRTLVSKASSSKPSDSKSPSSKSPSVKPSESKSSGSETPSSKKQ